MGVVAYLQTHKTWTALWAGFAIFWIIAFGFYCAKLDNVVFEGKPFYMTFQNSRKHNENGRTWPAWLVCPGIGESATITAACHSCKPPREDSDGNPGSLECSPLPSHSPNDDHKHVQSCLVFNNAGGDGDDVTEKDANWIQCDMNYTNTEKARIYLFDQQWPIDFENGHPVLPNGAVMHTLPQYTRTLLEISREVYEFKNDHNENSFVLMDGETYSIPQESPNESSFMIYYGTYVDRVFTQSHHNITTGFDFWYWIGFLGGISFFCYGLQSLIYAAISVALGWKEDDGFTTLA